MTCRLSLFRGRPKVLTHIWLERYYDLTSDIHHHTEGTVTLSVSRKLGGSCSALHAMETHTYSFLDRHGTNSQLLFFF